MDRRCAGLPYVGGRTVSPEERVRLVERSLRYERTSRRLLTGLLITGFALPISLYFGVQFHLAEVMFPIALIDIILLVGFGLKWNDSRFPLKVARLCRDDITVEIYQGEIERTIDAEPDVLLLQSVGLDSENKSQTLERLVPSCVLLTVNGNFIEELKRPAASQIAQSSPDTGLFPSRWPTFAPP